MRILFRYKSILVVTGFPAYGRFWPARPKLCPVALHRGPRRSLHVVVGPCCLGIKIGRADRA